MKIALVTGASSGLGKDTALRLLELGYTVYAAARRVDQMEDLRARGATPLQLDISREEDIVAAVSQITAQHGSVDVLVNNAGFGLFGAVEDLSLEDARYQFEVNLFGMARLTQLLIPRMRARGSGRIINVSSMGGKIYTPLGAWYHATKHAVEGWSDCLRLELAPFGIDVVVIEPGVIATSFGEVLLDPLLRNSAGGAYAKLAEGVAKGTRKAYERPDTLSPPSVVSDAIVAAIRARRPKTRYVAGKFARPLMFIRKYFGDRCYDRLIMSQVR